MIKKSEYTDCWLEVKEDARSTVHKEGPGEYPSDKWKKTILLAEHTPIRDIVFKWLWEIPSWVSVHFVRHSLGVLHFVSTQRDDRTGEDREGKPQGALVWHKVKANAQGLINVSRKRLCGQAHPKTRAAWMEVKAEVAKVDAVLASVMVPECIYRGFCPEFKSCGFVDTEEYARQLAEYRRKG